MTFKNISILIVTGLLATACSSNNEASFSLASKSQSASQAFEVQKVDILWVIDDSGSMKSSQEALASNFESFASKFIEKDYDFQMAITTTGAYSDNSNFVGGIMGKSTPNFVDTFVDNVLVGIDGNIDERGMQSSVASMARSGNQGLVRNGSQLAIIIVSDEDDTSKDSNQVYLEELAAMTGSTLDKSNFSISAITISDSDCLKKIGSWGSSHKIGKRYMEVAEATNGTVTSICDDFSDSLKQISDKILNKTEKIVLNEEPIVESISVYINNELVPQADTSLPQDEWSGWVYTQEGNTITFHGGIVPSASADFRINFTPKSL